MDFVKRVPMDVLNKRTVESLIKGGAFDGIDPNRRALFQVHDEAIDQVMPIKRKQAEGQFDLFAEADDDGENESDALGDAQVTIPDIEEWEKSTKLNFERQMLGLYVSDHPLSGMTSVLAGMRDMSIAQLLNRANTMGNQTVTLAGLVTAVDRRVSKKGNPWAIVTIEDLESSIQCMFFGKVYEANADDLSLDSVIRVRGLVELRDEESSLRVTDMEVPMLESADERPLTITLPRTALDRGRMERLAQILKTHPGYCQVRLAVTDERGNVRMLTFGDGFRTTHDTSMLAEIKSVFGPSCLPSA